MSLSAVCVLHVWRRGVCCAASPVRFAIQQTQDGNLDTAEHIGSGAAAVPCDGVGVVRMQWVQGVLQE